MTCHEPQKVCTRLWISMAAGFNEVTMGNFLCNFLTTKIVNEVLARIKLMLNILENLQPLEIFKLKLTVGIAITE